jgi:hypothetical protein
MEPIHIPLGQGPKVLISISEECCWEHCESCPGIFERDNHTGLIFCFHGCHKVTESGELGLLVSAAASEIG